MLFCCSCWLFLSKWKKQYKVPQWGFNISRLTTQKQWQRKRVNTTYKGVAEKMELSSFQTCLEKTTKAHGCKQHEVNSSWISESKNIHSETGVSPLLMEWDHRAPKHSPSPQQGGEPVIFPLTAGNQNCIQAVCDTFFTLSLCTSFFVPSLFNPSQRDCSWF